MFVIANNPSEFYRSPTYSKVMLEKVVWLPAKQAQTNKTDTDQTAFSEAV